jgi:hypothetical protein
MSFVYWPANTEGAVAIAATARELLFIKSAARDRHGN